MARIDSERLSETFLSLVRIDSESRHEAAIHLHLKNLLTSMGAEVATDRAGEGFGGEIGNLVARFPGNRDVEPMLLNAHMDTVNPGRGVRPQFKDGVFTSDGTTILGADDKSAIAVLLEVLRVIQENDLPHGPLDLLLTVGEEIGLMGAKHMDPGLLRARFGYALDTTDTDGIVVRAPGANRLTFTVFGKEAHAGVVPERGINAIALAAKAIAALDLGRIDAETTCNIGQIEGGAAVNIVPNRVVVKGEARSHDAGKLERVTNRMLGAFEDVVATARRNPSDDLPRLEADIEEDFRPTHIPEEHPVVTLARQAAANLGREIKAKSTGGGADANVFFANGIITGVLGTGMRDMHTLHESVALADMVKAAELVLEIIRLHAAG
ncbi:MAG: M20/M25/M40 family metallo-hydrolase [Desulfobacterales bacterium]|jgi:tripeptide aminopeptidase|nr:M20/M25/M40 family metallo-hydrolase [Desulfobacteraceae bacterium]MDD3992592.1 M20/M25/M40 family metallo-hydrolase [Desulfobacteraceae bacterium]MDY0310881.1 M20/M25/M40 family metallo-hydrolase [Desulfobacterales bacterium]